METNAGWRRTLLIGGLLIAGCGGGGAGGGSGGSMGGGGSGMGGGAGGGGDGGPTTAALVISDGPAFDFGDVAMGGTAEHRFTVQNTGGGAATMMRVAPSLGVPFGFSGGSFPGVGGTCTDQLAAGASCVVVVRFSPSVPARATATLSLAYGATDVTTRDLAGTGAAAARLELAEGATFDFGVQAVGSASDHTFTVSNTGGVAATALSASADAGPFAPKGGTFPGAGGTCSATLAPGASCTLVLTFSPSSAGSAAASATVRFNDGLADASVTISLRGTGAPPAAVTITDAPGFDFGNVVVGASADHTFTVANGGGVAAGDLAATALAAPLSWKGGAFPGTGGTCGATLAGQARCTIVVTASPSAVGAFAGTLSLSFSDGVASRSAACAVSGTAVPPALLVISDGPTFDFGTQGLSVSATHVFTIENQGGAAARAVGLASPLAAPFALAGASFAAAGTCAAIVPAFSSCTVGVTFAPSAIGAATGSLAIGYDDGTGARTASRAMAGSGTDHAHLAISDGPTYDFGTRAVGTSLAHAFTVANNGSVAATAIVAAAPAAPFAFAGGAFPGTGGTCGARLDPGQSCSIAVAFAPTVVGAAGGSLRVDYNDGFGAQSDARALAGAGTDLAFLGISDGPRLDFGSVTAGGTAERTLIVTNTGLAGARSIAGGALAAPFGWKGGAFPGTGGTCDATLAAATTCTLVVTFHPTAPGLSADVLGIAYDNGTVVVTASRALAGSALAPALIVLSDEPSYDFGTRASGSAATHVFTAINAGGVPATGLAASGLAAPFAFAGGVYPGSGGTCAQALGPSTSCTLVVTFAPVASGAASASVTLGYGDGNGTQSASVGLTGTGAAPALLAISDGPTYDFGTQAIGGAAAEHAFTVTNSGGVDATAVGAAALAAPFAWKGGSYPGAGGTCAATLVAGATCTVMVTFAPASAGAASATLGLAYGDGVANRSATRALAGAGAAPAALAISDGPTYDFGTRAVGSAAAEHTFTVSNSGGVAASALSASALSGPLAYAGGAFPGSAGTCGASLAAAATCTFVVAFAPAAAGATAATVTISYGSGVTTASAAVGLAGTGAAPALLAISDGPTYDFGTQATGSTSTHAFTVTNGGGVAATAIAPGALAAPLAFKGGVFPGTGSCGASLAAGATCTFLVTFAPTAAGAAGDTVTLAYADGAASASASVGLAGTGAAPALLTISDGPTYDFGTHATGSATEHTFTVANGGGVAATGMGGTLAAPFAYKGGAYPGTGSCAATLSAGVSCTVVVVFSPASAAPSAGTLGLGYADGAAARTATRALSGTGAAPATLAISDGPLYAFGIHATGSTTTHTFTVSNGGGVAATGIAGALAAPFGFAGGSYPGAGGSCATALAAGTSCTVSVAFAPTANGQVADKLTLGYDDGTGVAHSALVNLSGAGAAPAQVVISDAPGYDFGSVATGTSVSHVFAVQNTGGTVAGQLAAGVLAAPFSYAGGGYPGTGGSCGAALVPGDVCTIVVRFSPPAVGPSSAALALSFDDGAGGRSVSRALTGAGTNAAYLVVTDFPPQYYSVYGLAADPAVFEFGGIGLGGAGVQHQFTVTNNGAAAATAMSGAAPGAPFGYTGGAFPGVGGTCGATLAAGASCTVSVSFAPTVAAASGASLTVSYYDGVGSRSVARALHGTGTTAPVLAIYDFQGVNVAPAWSFGTRGIGVSDDHQFFVYNTGGATAINLTAAAVGVGFGYKGGVYPGTGATCGATLAAGASCTIDVVFSPVAAGAASGTIRIDYGASGVGTTWSATRAVAGVGTALASLEIWNNGQPFNELIYDYGVHPTGTATPHTFTLANPGAATATGIAAAAIAAPFAYAGGAYPGTGGTCTSSLAAATSCTLIVTFTPSAGGAATARVAVTYNDGVTGRTAGRDLAGTGTPYAFLSVRDWQQQDGGGNQSFDYGSSGIPTDHTFYVRNDGAQAATALAGVAPAAPFSFTGGAFPGQGGTCSGSLAAGAECTVVVTFSGAASGGGTWSVSYADGSGATRTAGRDLTGTSVSAALLLVSDCDQCGQDDQPADFGSTGGSMQRTFFVRNVGAHAATVMADGGTLGDGFGWGTGNAYPGPGGNCGTQLASGATCTLGVVFVPGAPGAHASALTVTYNDGVAARSASRALAGTGVSTALLDIRDWPGNGGGGGGPNDPPYDYGHSGVAVDHTFYVSNDGVQTATGMGPSAGIGAGFSWKGGSYPGSGGDCAAQLAAGASCSVVVTFAPPAPGTYAGTFAISYQSNNGATGFLASRDVSGTGVAGAYLQLTPWGVGGSVTQTFDYGAYGTPVEHTFSVTNFGLQTATAIADASAFGGNFAYKGGGYPGTGGTCTATLLSGASCDLVVVFQPSGTGSRSGTIALGYSDGTGASPSALQGVLGTAITGPALRILDWDNWIPSPSPPPFDYGTWGIPTDHMFTVSNVGSQGAANITDGGGLGGAFAFTGGAYPGTGGTCTGALASGTTCTIVVRFTPAGSGQRTSTVKLAFTDGAAQPMPPAARDLTATATLGALVQLTEWTGGGCGDGCGPYDFGAHAVGTHTDATFNLSNIGGASTTAMGDAALLGLPFSWKGGTYPGTGGTCTTSLASGAACTVVVQFSPTAAVTSNGVAGVSYGDGLGQTQKARRSVRGTGTP